MKESEGSVKQRVEGVVKKESSDKVRGQIVDLIASLVLAFLGAFTLIVLACS